MGSISDMKSLEEHFSKMAERGWMIDKIGAVNHRYRAAEPCKKRFFVDLLPSIGTFDYPDNDDAKSYRQICEESGWTFISANGQFHVFCAEGDENEITPIHTDNKIQAKLHIKAIVKFELLTYIYCLVMFSIFAFLQFRFTGYDIYLSNMAIFSLFGWMFFLLGVLWSLTFVLVRIFKLAKAAKEDLPMPKISYRSAKARTGVQLTLFAIAITFFFGGMVLEIAGGMSLAIISPSLACIVGTFVGFWIRRQINTKERTRKQNRNLFIGAMAIMVVVLMVLSVFSMYLIFTLEENAAKPVKLPVITLSDVTEAMTPNNTYYDVFGSIAVPLHYSYGETTNKSDLSMEVFRPINKKIAQDLFNHYAKMIESDDEMTYFHLGTREAALWGADVAVETAYGSNVGLLLMRDKTILRVWFCNECIEQEAVQQAVQSFWLELALVK